MTKICIRCGRIKENIEMRRDYCYECLKEMKIIKDKKIRCECCDKLIVKRSSSMLCNNCSLYTSQLKNKIRYLKRKAEALSIKLYGTKSGWERVRR